MNRNLGMFSDFNAEGILTPGTATGAALLPCVIRPDAELIQRSAMDQFLIADQGIALPAYTTSAKTLKASTNITPTISVASDHDYYVTVFTFAKPYYSDETIAKGREEYCISAYLYELVQIPAGTYKAFNGKTVGVQRNFVAHGLVRNLHWNTATSVALYTATTYGVAMGATAPTISGTTITLKTPTELIRGHTTYLTSDMWGKIDDIRFQFVIEAWRAPKNNLNIDGWELQQSMMHVLDCVNDDGKLT